MTMVSTKVFAHGGCVDGMTALTIARQTLGRNNATYEEVYYGRPFPEFAARGVNVYILDFCPPIDVLERILKDECANLYVFDHHITAEEMVKDAQWRLKDWDNLFIEFDMKRSGAGITADFFYRRNWWVNYVEDRDLWRWALPNSKVINAFIQSVERTMDGYDLAMKDHGPEEARVLGMGAERYLEMYVREVVKQSRKVDFAEFTEIPVVNAAFVGISEVVGELAKEALFGVGWSQNSDGQLVVSLRSRGEFNVSKLAKRYGGGGHERAAGFTLTPSLNPIPKELRPLFIGLLEG